MSLVPATKTPLDDIQIALALFDGHKKVFDTAPNANRVGIAWAQIALETGRGRAIHCNNFGNVIWQPGTPGNHWEYVCSERLDPVNRPNEWTKVRMRFRAYSSPADGAASYWKVLASSRHCKALPLMDQGKVIEAMLALGASGYYTAYADKYANAVRLHHDYYLEKVQFSLVSMRKPADPVGGAPTLWARDPDDPYWELVADELAQEQREKAGVD